MNAKNKTGLKTLDKLAADPRVKVIERDADGIWCVLESGYQNGADPGTHCIHEYTAKDVLGCVQLIKSCACRQCKRNS
jgi:hypothetical protein